jgi:hypothetical protein
MDDEPKASPRIRDVPTDVLAHNVVGQLIKAKGQINLWDILLEHLIKLMREEYAEDVEYAKLYRFLRNDDNWGEDTDTIQVGDVTLHRSGWDVLGESSGEDFDAVVRERMLREGYGENNESNRPVDQRTVGSDG